MTKTEALKQTRDRFTNLLDGSVKPNASVGSIISYYESLLKDEKPSYEKPISGIEANFYEEELKMYDDLENEYYW